MNPDQRMSRIRANLILALRESTYLVTDTDTEGNDAEMRKGVSLVIEYIETSINYLDKTREARA